VSDPSVPLAARADDPAPAATLAPAALPGQGRWIATGAAVLAALAAAAFVLAWNTQQRIRTLEGELVKRQQDSGALAAEARLLAVQAQEGTRDASGKLALLEARVAESSMQRTQIEDLLQSMARSRDENVLSDVDAALRMAQQQSAITGSADALITALRQADERLARYNHPRLERVRRAMAKDLERARPAGADDEPLLSIRLDDVIRRSTNCPCWPPSTVAPWHVQWSGSVAPRPRRQQRRQRPGRLGRGLGNHWHQLVDRIGDEARSLVRVTRIDVPEAMLQAPEQASSCGKT
jgi:uroporphyrin-3 C-methyltransferase